MLFCILGLDISIVHAIYNLVKKKAIPFHMWRGAKKTREYTTNRYLEVGIISETTFTCTECGFRMAANADVIWQQMEIGLKCPFQPTIRQPSM